MVAVGIKEIKINPSVISKSINNSDEYIFISKRGKPIAVAMSLENEIFDFGLKSWVMIQAFKNGDLSLGQLSKALGKSYTETMELLGLLKIPLFDYDIESDLATLEEL